MTRRILGIDVGLDGAIALMVGGTLVEVVDMPTLTVLRNGKNKRQVSVAQLVEILNQYEPTEAYIENVFARTGEGVTSVFSFGRSLGVLEGAIAARCIKSTLVTPQEWQKAMKVTGGKDGSRKRAMEIFPKDMHYFKRVKDDGRSDAALIACYGFHHG